MLIICTAWASVQRNAASEWNHDGGDGWVSGKTVGPSIHWKWVIAWLLISSGSIIRTPVGSENERIVLKLRRVWTILKKYVVFWLPSFSQLIRDRCLKYISYIFLRKIHFWSANCSCSNSSGVGVDSTCPCTICNKHPLRFETMLPAQDQASETTLWKSGWRVR